MWNLGQISFLVAAGIYGATDVGLAHALTLGPAGRRVQRGAHPGPQRPPADGRARLHLGTTSPDTRSVVSRFVPVIAGRGVDPARRLPRAGPGQPARRRRRVGARPTASSCTCCPISLFGMAVAAAELPELARLGERGLQAHQRAPRLRAGPDRLLRALHRGAVPLRGRRRRRRAAAARRVHRRRHPPGVAHRRPRSRSGLLGTTRSRLLQNALYALDRSRTRRPRWRCCARRWPPGSARCSCSRSTGWRSSGSELSAIGDLGLRPAPDALRLVDHGTPRLGDRRPRPRRRRVLVGRVPAPARGAPSRASGCSRAARSTAAWCVLAAFAAGVLAAGLRAATADLPRCSPRRSSLAARRRPSTSRSPRQRRRPRGAGAGRPGSPACVACAARDGAATSASAPTRGPGPTTPGSTPSCSSTVTAATSSTATGTGRVEAIVADLDERRHPYHVAVENWVSDLNIGTVVRNANAFGAASVQIVGKRRWNRRGAMVTDRYQHVVHVPTIDELLAWALAEDLPLIGIDNLPGSVPLEATALPERCILLFGQEGPGPVRRRPSRGATASARSSRSAPPARSTPASPPASRCTPGSASTPSRAENGPNGPCRPDHPVRTVRRCPPPSAAAVSSSRSPRWRPRRRPGRRRTPRPLRAACRCRHRRRRDRAPSQRSGVISRLGEPSGGRLASGRPRTPSSRPDTTTTKAATSGRSSTASPTSSPGTSTPTAAKPAPRTMAGRLVYSGKEPGSLWSTSVRRLRPAGRGRLRWAALRAGRPRRLARRSSPAPELRPAPRRGQRIRALDRYELVVQDVATGRARTLWSNGDLWTTWSWPLVPRRPVPSPSSASRSRGIRIIDVASGSARTIAPDLTARGVVTELVARRDHSCCSAPGSWSSTSRRATSRTLTDQVPLPGRHGARPLATAAGPRTGRSTSTSSPSIAAGAFHNYVTRFTAGPGTAPSGSSTPSAKSSSWRCCPMAACSSGSVRRPSSPVPRRTSRSAPTARRRRRPRRGRTSPRLPVLARPRTELRRAADDGLARQHDEVVAVDDLVGGALGEVGRAAAGHRCAARPRRRGPGPSRTPCRRGRRSPPRRPAANAPLTSRTPAASSDTPRSRSAVRAPSSTTIVPRRPDRERDPELAGGQPPRAAGGSTVPAPGAPGDDVVEHALAGRLRDDGADARPRGDLGGGQLRRHPAAAPHGATGTGHRLELVVDLHDLLDQRRRGVEPGVGGEQAGGVGEQHEQVGRHEVRRPARRGGRCRRSGSRRRPPRRSR